MTDEKTDVDLLDEFDLHDDEFSEDAPDSLSLSDLQPTAHPTFTLADGTVIDFRVQEEMDTDEYAQLSNIQKRMVRGLDAMEKSPTNKNAQMRFTRLSSAMIALILPEIPRDLLESLTLGQKGKVIEYWVVETGQVQDEKK